MTVYITSDVTLISPAYRCCITTIDWICWRDLGMKIKRNEDKTA